MNREDAIEVLSQIAACWPAFSKEATDESMDQWVRDLMLFDYEISHATVSRLHSTLVRAPVWSQFAEIYRSLKPKPKRDEPANVLPRDVVAERIAGLRADLKRVGRWSDQSPMKEQTNGR